MFERLGQDIRYALRGFRNSPGFTVVSLLSIAIGVGATTAIVTLANTLLLTPPPGIGNADRVVAVGRTQDGEGFDNFSYPTYQDYTGATSLSGLAAIRMDPEAMSLAGESEARAVQGGMVSGNFFQVLEATAEVGRFFGPADDTPSAGLTVVLNHRFWSSRFGSDRGVVGRTLVLNGMPATVVGVAARGFQGPFVIAPDLWVPIRFAARFGMSENLFTQRRSVWLMAIGRLAPEASLMSAQTELSTIAVRLRQAYPRELEHQGVRVMKTSLFPGGGRARNAVAGFLALLLGIAGLVLAIASTNVAGMLLARAARRQREVAIRMAVGAPRGRLIRQVVTESLVLFGIAGGLGILLARGIIQGLLALVPRLPVPLSVQPHMDWRVLGFALGTALLVGLAAGLVPALRGTRPALVPALKLEAGTTAGRQRLRGVLLVAQLAFSMLLLVVAGLFATSLVRARAIDPGFEPEGVQVTALDFHLAGYDDSQGLQHATALLEQARRQPGVESAALMARLPLEGGGMGLGGVEVAGRPYSVEQHSWPADWNVVTPGSFATLEAPLLRGRDFSESDLAGSQDVAILNRGFAIKLYGTEDVVGRTFQNGDLTVTVIGVAKDGKYRTLGEDPRNYVYVAFAQRYRPALNLVVRSADPAVQRTIARLIHSAEPLMPILDQRSLSDQVASSLFPQQLALWVAGTLGGVALFLALLGVYGVVAFGVTQRTREIGVRIALGAQRGQVRRLVVRQGGLLAVVALAIGGLVALLASKALASILYAAPGFDLVAFGGAALLLGGAAFFATWVPARRAAAINPMVALRAE